MAGSAYRSAGVDIDAQDRALRRIAELARTTRTGGVVADVGGFGGLFRPELRGLGDPVLVASADGVGTKLLVAKMVGDYSTVGRDLVNHCVNDVLAQGARPLFFLDYVGAGALEPETMVALVGGVAAGCRENGCALLGGETAEMPGFYAPGDYELVGFIVGLAEGGELPGRGRVGAGDALVGLPSAGLHTNGFSLARRILFEELQLSVDDPIPEAASPEPVGRRLLAPHRSYLGAVGELLGHAGVHAMVHVTGGGLKDNVPRVLPRGRRARIRLGSWDVPEIFRLLQRHGGVEDEEMLRVFNMGIGMVLVVARKALSEVLGHLESVGEEARVIGAVEDGESGVVFGA